MARSSLPSAVQNAVALLNNDVLTGESLLLGLRGFRKYTCSVSMNLLEGVQILV